MAYTPIVWQNRPNTSTPVGAKNLNKMDSAIARHDVEIRSKAEQTVVNGTINSVSIDNITGNITVSYVNGAKDVLKTNLAKITTNMTYDADTQSIALTYPDGTSSYVPLADFVTQYEFDNSNEIIFTVTSDGHISASIPNGSITEEKLQPNFLADVKTNAENAKSSEINANYDAQLSKSYSIGGSGIREGEDTDNAKYYKEEAKRIVDKASKGSVTGVKGSNETEYRTGDVNLSAENIGAVPVGGEINNNTVTFAESEERENINTGETASSLFGKIRKWLSDFKSVAFSGSYNDLDDKPTIPTITNNLLATEAGTALDAAQGKALNDGLTNLSNKINYVLLNNRLNLNNISEDGYYIQGNGEYVIEELNYPKAVKGRACFIFHKNLESYRLQILIQAQDNTDKPDVYIRWRSWTGVWFDWCLQTNGSTELDPRKISSQPISNTFTAPSDGWLIVKGCDPGSSYTTQSIISIIINNTPLASSIGVWFIPVVNVRVKRGITYKIDCRKHSNESGAVEKPAIGIWFAPDV